MSRGTGALALAGGTTLLVAAPRPATSIATLRGLLGQSTGSGTPVGRPLGTDQGDALVGVLAVAGLAAWLLVSYLVLLALLTWATRLPQVGVVCAAVLQRAAPAAVRSAVAVSIGAVVVVGTTSVASAAQLAPSAEGTNSSAGAADPGAVGDLDWPVAPAPTATPPASSSPSPKAASSPSAPATTPAGSTPTPTGPETTEPTGPTAVETGPSRTTAAAAPGQVVVQAGDTLWGLAAQSLPAGASDAAVATTWPQWWETNRAVVGEDPDQLWPGQVLQAPV